MSRDFLKWSKFGSEDRRYEPPFGSGAKLQPLNDSSDSYRANLPTLHTRCLLKGLGLGTSVRVRAKVKVRDD